MMRMHVCLYAIQMYTHTHTHTTHTPHIHTVMYRRQCMRMITRSVLFLARKVFNYWAYMAETTKIFSERCERFVAARNEVLRNLI